MQNRITDKDSFELSYEVYKNFKVGRSIARGKFKVLAVENNINSGMQVMVEAPVDRKEEIEIFQKLNNQIKRV